MQNALILRKLFEMWDFAGIGIKLKIHELHVF